jgi:hypothetical protein
MNKAIKIVLTLNKLERSSNKINKEDEGDDVCLYRQSRGLGVDTMANKSR